ncbi:MAG: trypsin-like peptidase domain-containing protein [Bacteroidia bacterium]|nr:trypsin-like peptidase domain-containing protein [Bacteroidia bacterium]
MQNFVYLFNKNKFLLLAIVGTVVLCNSLLAQKTVPGQPKSFKLNENLLSKVATIRLPKVDINRLLAEDELEQKTGTKPFRFGATIPLQLTPQNSGSWSELPNEDRIWRLAITSPGAYSLHFNFKNFFLPPGAELYFYTPDKQYVQGAYTELNNAEHGEFMSFPLPGEKIYIEYYEPAAVRGKGKFTIVSAIHGYKNTFAKDGTALGFGNSAPCNVNINCLPPFQTPEWQRLKKSVAMILTCGGTRICTGTLIQNTKQDSTPYVLTADHCLCGNVNTWTFVFNYESPNCLLIDGSTTQRLQGCVLRAHSPKSDFALVELLDKPQKYFDVHYAGWNRTNIASLRSYVIHHPSGDIRKISVDSNYATSTPYLEATQYNDTTHWRIGSWEIGSTEPGSSGSALFNENFEIIGQLHGGKASCSNRSGSDYFGKLWYSWDRCGNSPSEQLKPWLDPINTNALSLSIPYPTQTDNPLCNLIYTHFGKRPNGFIPFDVNADSKGNFYIAASFNKPLAATNDSIFGIPISTLSYAGNFDAIILKINNQGKVLWHKVLKSPGNDWIYQIVLDAQDNLYITGTYKGAANIDNQNLDGFSTSDTSANAFIIKLSANGSIEWKRELGSQMGDDFGHALAVKNNVLYVLTVQQQGANFPIYLHKLSLNNGGILESTLIPNFVIAALPSNLRDIKQRRLHLVVDSLDNAYIAGWHHLGSNTTNAILLKYSISNHHAIWVKSLGSNEIVQFKGLTLDTNNIPYLTGEYKGNFSWGATNFSFFNNNQEARSGFYAKINPANGNPLWIHKIEASRSIVIRKIICTRQNDIYMAAGTTFDLPEPNPHFKANNLLLPFAPKTILMRVNPNNGNITWVDEKINTTDLDLSHNSLLDTLYYLKTGFSNLEANYRCKDNNFYGIPAIENTPTGGILEWGKVGCSIPPTTIEFQNKTDVSNIGAQDGRVRFSINCHQLLQPYSYQFLHLENAENTSSWQKSQEPVLQFSNLAPGTYTLTIIDRSSNCKSHTIQILEPYPVFEPVEGPIGGYWVTNGAVYCFEKKGDTLFIGGGFTKMGPYTGAASAINIQNPQEPIDIQFPKLNGQVYAALPDGQGGWFIGGSFTKVGLATQRGLVHIKSDYTINPLWIGTDSTVFSLARRGDTLFVGGAFNYINGVARSKLAAIRISNGSVLNWTPTPNAAIYKILVHQNQLFVAGRFEQISGQNRPFVAAFSLSTLQLSSWNPKPDGEVFALEAQGNFLYIGGRFVNVGNQSCKRIAKINIQTGLASTWNAQADNEVLSLKLWNNILFMGGGFSQVNQSPRIGLAAISTESGNLLSWNPQANGIVYALDIKNNILWAGGSFTAIGDSARNFLAAIDLSTGRATNFKADANHAVFTIVPAPTSPIILVGGLFSSIGALPASYLAAYNEATQKMITTWRPRLNNAVRSMRLSGDTLVIGGLFNTINNTERRHLAALRASNAELLNWNPSPNGTVNAIEISNNIVYFGGRFTQVGNQERRYLAASNLHTLGAPTPWNPKANGEVFALAIQNDTVYVGGAFTQIDNKARYRMASLAKSSGSAYNWDPSINGNVLAIALDNIEQITIGGNYTQVNVNTTAKSRYRMASLAKNQNDAPATNFAPSADGSVQTLAIQNETLYVGGCFDNLSNAPRPFLGSFDLNSHSLTNWNPKPNGAINTLMVKQDKVYVGGNFSVISGQRRSGFVVFYECPSIERLAVTTNSPVCQGSTLQLSATLLQSRAAYLWKGPNGYTATTARATLANFSTLNVGIYTLMVAVQGCDTLRIPVTVEVLKQPIIEATPSACQGQTVTLKIQPNSITSSTQYFWKGPNNFSTSGTEVTISYFSTSHAGIYSLIGVSGNCTTATATHRIELFNQPNIEGTAFICEGNEINLKVKNAPQVPGLQFTWAGPSNFTSTGPMITRFNAQINFEGTYTVTVTGGNCPTTSAEFRVQLIQKPFITSPAAVFCQGQNLELQVTNIQYVESLQYQWIMPGGQSAQGTTLILNNLSLQNQGIYYVIAQHPSCSISSLPININIVPTPILQGPSLLCVGQNFNLNIINPSSIGGVQYQWFLPHGGAATGTSITRLNITPAQTGTYSVRAITPQCTTPTTSFILTVLSAPQIETYSPIYCQGQVARLSINNPITHPELSYIWQGPNAFSRTSNAIEFPIQSTIQAGVYRVAPNLPGCDNATAQANIEILEQPQIKGPKYICQGQSLMLTVQSPVTHLPVQYQWQMPNNMVREGTSLQISSASLQNSGNYRLIAISPFCTTTPATHTVTFIPVPQVVSNQTLCQGETLVLAVQNAVSGVSYIWSGPNNFQAIGATVQRVNVRLIDAGIYTVRAESEECNLQPQTIKVVINENPTPPILRNTTACSGETVTLVALTEVLNATFLWQGPSGIRALTSEPRLTIPQASVSQGGIYSLQVIHNNCTSALATTQLTIWQTPSLPDPSPNKLAYCPNERVVFRPTSSGAARFQWQGPGGFSLEGPGPEFIQPQITQANEGLYRVRAISVQGCTSDWASVILKVLKGPARPHISYNSPICQGRTLRLEAYTVDSAQIIWESPAGQLYYGNSILINNTTTDQSGNWNLSASKNGCTTHFETFGVQIDPALEVPSIVGNREICHRTSTILRASPLVEGAEYTWLTPNQEIIKSTQIEAKSPGNYELFVQRGSCQVQAEPFSLRWLPPLTVPIVTSSIVTCANSDVYLSAQVNETEGSFEWRGPAGFYSNLPNPVIYSITTLQGGRYQVTYQKQGCRSLPASVDVSVLPQPAPPTLASLPSQFCVGQSLNLRVLETNATRYIWQTPGRGTLSTTQPNLSLSNLTTADHGLYAIQIVSNGCTSASTTRIINILASPSIQLNQSSQQICQGQNFTIEAEVNNAQQSTWLGPNGITQVGNILQIINASSVHQGTYTIVATNAGCSTSTTIMVNIQALPPIPRVRSNSPICEQQLLRLEVESQPGMIYRWQGPAGFTITSVGTIEISNLTTLNSGIYTVVAISGNCTSNTTITNVAINPLPPSITIQTNAPICAGQTLSFSATSFANLQYQWLGPNGISSNSASWSIPNATTQHTGTYSLIVRNSHCTAPLQTIFATVNEGVPEAIRASNNSPICAGSTLQLSASILSPNLNYYWQGPNGFSSTASRPSIPNASTQNTGTYSLIVTNGNCSSRINTTFVTILPAPPEVEISHNSPLCEGQTLQFSPTFVEGAQYLWRGPSGFTSTLMQPTLANIATWQGGTYTLTVFIGSCTKIASTDVNIVPIPPQPIISGITEICRGQRLELRANSPGIDQAQYIWQGPDNFQASTELLVRNNMQPSNAGRYTAYSIFQGCTSLAQSAWVTVRDIPVVNEINSNSPICVGQLLRLTAPLLPNTSYRWQGPAGFSSTLANPLIPNATTLHTGIYTLQLNVDGCQNITPLTVSVQVNAPPQLSITITANSPVCEGSDLELAATYYPGLEYQWQGPSGFKSQQPNIILRAVTLAQSGRYFLTTRFGGCTLSTLAQDITVYPAHRNLVASNNGPLCAGQSLNLTASFYPGANYFWNTPKGELLTMNNPSITQAQLHHSGTYTVTAVVGSCSTTATTEVVINSCKQAGSEIQENAILHFTTYPNPAQNLVYFQSTQNLAGTVLVEINDILGTLVERKTILIQKPTSELAVDISQLAAGMYQFKLIYEEKIFAFKIIKY